MGLPSLLSLLIKKETILTQFIPHAYLKFRPLLLHICANRDACTTYGHRC